MKDIPKKIWNTAIAAIQAGETDELGPLLDSHPDICRATIKNYDDHHDGMTLLLVLLDWPGGKPNHVETARLLLAAGSDPNVLFRGGESALHFAASNDRDVALIPLLVEAGADTESGGGCARGGTPSMNAVHYGKRRAAEQLAACGASIYNLHIAVGLDRLDIARSWLQSDGIMHADAARLLPTDPPPTDSILDPAQTQKLLTEAFGCAVFCEQYRAADWLLEHGAEIDVIGDGAESTLLHQVAYRGRLPMAMYLCARGADVNVGNRDYGVPPFCYGGAHGNVETMHYLIDNGSEVNPKQAASFGRLDKIAALPKSRVNAAALLAQTIGTHTDVGKTIDPRIMAGRLAVARYLLQQYAGCAETEIDGKTAIERAEASGQPGLAEVFRSGGAG